MPYLYTGKTGRSESRHSYIKLASRQSGLGFRMAAVIKAKPVKTFSADCYLYPRTTKVNWTANAVYVPQFGAYVTASYDTNAVASIGIYQGTVSGGPVTTQKFYRLNPTTGTYSLVATVNQATCIATDYSTPLGTAFSYRIDGYNASGTFVSSVTSPSLTITGFDDWYLTRGSSDYELISLKVSDSNSSIVLQSEDFQPLASEYKTVQRGEIIGRKGTVEVVVTRDERNSLFPALRELTSYLGQVYLKSPFGDVYAIDMGAMQIEFVNNGNMKVRLPFIENAVA